MLKMLSHKLLYCSAFFVSSLLWFAPHVAAVEVEDVSKESPQLQLEKVRVQNGELQLQISQLITEIARLRGDIEAHDFRIEKLETYNATMKAEAAKQKAQALAQHTTTIVNQNIPATAPVAGDLSSYEAAFSLLKQKKYQPAHVAFKDYITKYPNGVYLPNTYYWLGELELLENNTKASQTAFSMVVKTSPEHRKASDARYKLAQIHQRLGEHEQAKELLQTVINSNRKDSRVRGLAQSFWDKHYTQ